MKFIRILLLLNLAFLANASIEPTTGRYVGSYEDLSIAIIGGPLIWQREYRERQWVFNRAWEPLIFEYDSATNLIRRIIKGGDSYEKLDAAGTVFKFGPRMKIRKNSNGTWTWKDRNGNTIEYTDSGKTLSLHRQEGSSITLLYNGDDKVSGATDTNGTQVIWITYDLISGKVNKVWDYDNREVFYTWEEVTGNSEPVRHKMTQFKNVRGFDWAYEYSNSKATDGRVDLVKITDPELGETVINYSGASRVISTKNALGLTTAYEFDYIKSNKNYYLKTSFPGGRVTESWFKRDGKLSRHDINGFNVRTVIEDLNTIIEKDLYGKVTKREFDEFNNLKKITYPDGTYEEFTYNISNTTLISHQNKNGVKSAYVYNNKGHLELVTEAVGETVERQIEIENDQFGQVRKVTSLADTLTTASVTEYFYDSYGNVEKIIDGNLREQLYDHNSMGYVTKFTDGRLKEWDFEYDAIGNLKLKRTPNQFETKFEYDKTDYLVEVEYPDLAKKNYEVDRLGRVTKITDELGGEFINVYSDNGKISQVISEEGEVTNYEYDLLGRLKAIKQSDNQNTLFTYTEENGTGLSPGAFYQPINIQYPTYNLALSYDLQNRIVQEKYTYDSDGQPRTEEKNVVYDAAGNVIKTSGNSEREITFEYDALNRRTKRYFEGDLHNQYEYDSRDNLIGFIDAESQRHRHEYDKENNLTKIYRPMNEFHEFVFDENNYVKTKIDAIGNRIEFEYDDDSRQIGTKVYNNNQELMKTIVYSLNNRDAMEGYDDGTLVGTLDYDLKLNKLSESVEIHGQIMSHSYEYYKNGLAKSFTGVDDVKYNYFYENTKLTNIVIPNQGNMTFSNFYGPNPQLVNFPGNIQKELTYDGMGKVLDIVVKDPAQTSIFDHKYQYNDRNLLSSKTTMQGMHEYTYSDLDYLSTATHPTLANENYQYDKVGNRELSLATDDTEWQYNSNNQLLDSVTNRFAYDDNGNMTEMKNANDDLINGYVYDEAMRLSQVTDAGGLAIFEYHYDPFGRRVFKHNVSTDEYTYFHYSDEGLVHERASSGESVDYLHSPGSKIATRPVLKKANDSYFYYLNDHLGTPHKIINEGAQIMLAREYSAFGEINVYSMNGGHSDSLSFPGQYLDQEKPSNYNVNRDYMPQFGRYMQRDPLGTGPVPNEYVYGSHLPLNFIDPDGLLKLGGGICVGIGARACAELEVEVSWTCVTAKICFSAKIELEAGSKRKKPKQNSRKGRGSAEVGPWKGSNKGGKKKHKWNHRKPGNPDPPPNSSCFSGSVGCEINIPNFHNGYGYSSSGGSYGDFGSTIQDEREFKIGCKAKGCIQVYSSCNKCQGFNGCGD